jgi:OHCU decarboxylase
MDEESFLRVYGGIYENSPWIARQAWLQGGESLDKVEGLHRAMKSVVEKSSREARLALIRAHPRLAVKTRVGKALTEASAKEQAGAGLDQCSEEEFATFQRLNDAYVDKFGFPFVIAIRGLGRAAILAAFQRRIENDFDTEFETAIDQIHRIAWLRLMDLAEDGHNTASLTAR